MLFAVVFSACEDNVDQAPPVRMDLVMAKVDIAGRIVSIKVDDGLELNVVDVKHSSLLGSSSVRAIAYYSQNLDLMEAVVYDIANIPVLTPIFNLDADVSKQSPVTFIRGWVGSAYLNIEMGIKAKELKSHVIGFDEFLAEGQNSVNLMFVHDKGDDIDAATKKVLVSIPLLDYGQRFNGEAYTINLSFNTSKGVVEKQFKIAKR